MRGDKSAPHRDVPFNQTGTTHGSFPTTHHFQQVTRFAGAQSAGNAPRVVPHSPHPQNGREAARCNKFTPPQTQRTSPMSPPPSKSGTNLRFVNGGDMGEVLGERGRFGGREPPLSRGGSLPPRSFSKVFPLTSSAPPVRGAFSSFLSCGVRCSESSCADGSTSA